MKNTQKSHLLFFFGCIPARALLAYIAYSLFSTLSSTSSASLSMAQNIFIISTFLIGIGFWSIYINGWRKTGAETFGEKIWWNNLRPIHGTLYLLFSISALYSYKNAWMFLVVDVVFGIFAELINIYILTK